MALDHKTVSEQIGARLQRARTRTGMSQSQVAVEIGVAANTVTGWESGDRMPRAPELLALCDLYGTTADYLLGRSDHHAGLPVGELLVDAEAVERILQASTAAEIDELVDWHPQFISFWQVVKAETKVLSRRHVQALTFELMAHVQRVAPELWEQYEKGVQDLRRRQLRWERQSRHATEGQGDAQ